MNTETSTRAAAFSGHCQACGSLQKLPKNVLSLHGYKVDHGYFSGVCAGAKHQPFELSCNLIKTFIASARAALGSVETTQHELRQPATSTTCWVRPYMRGKYGRHAFKGGYVWTRAELRADDTAWQTANAGRPAADHFTEVVYTNTHPDVTPGHERHQAERAVRKSALNLLKLATEHNKARADWLEYEAKSLRRYIAWQTDRVNRWAPASLIPVVGKFVDDKQAFVPTEERV